jgi:DNA helicase HerA-like ATPase
VCRRIFGDAMKRFIENEPANFIQMYFEEAHNLFPRREERDLTIVYNRLAKEGQKLKLGLAYATQEVSSISSSILKNTQNWFVAHLNNRDELKELDKYYDFEDFTDSLRRTTDRGFIRMKTDSNTFIVPVQIDQFRVAEAN